MLEPEESLDVETLSARYRDGTLRPTQLIAGLRRRMELRGDDKVWIHRLTSDELLAYAIDLERRGPDGLPLYGIPFAIKDNIDLEGHPTTAACPDYRYIASQSASVVAKLISAGAIPIGKTNLDQFATGLVGVRSPYGVPGTASIRPTFPAAPVRAQRSPWRLGSSVLRLAPTRRVPVAYQQRSII